MLEAFGISDPGCVRPNNEDCYLLSPDKGLYVVADGMGGAQAGEQASKLAVDTLADFIGKAPEATADALAHAFQEANERVMSAAAKDANLEGMGTTLVAVLDTKPEVVIASVGDSRADVFDGEGLIVITPDQTRGNESGRPLGIGEVSLRSPPPRPRLTPAIRAVPDF